LQKDCSRLLQTGAVFPDRSRGSKKSLSDVQVPRLLNGETWEEDEEEESDLIILKK
jgi:hypothetical protein